MAVIQVFKRTATPKSITIYIYKRDSDTLEYYCRGLSIVDSLALNDYKLCQRMREGDLLCAIVKFGPAKYGIVIWDPFTKLRDTIEQIAHGRYATYSVDAGVIKEITELDNVPWQGALSTAQKLAREVARGQVVRSEDEVKQQVAENNGDKFIDLLVW